jgi:hypothetical protein
MSNGKGKKNKKYPSGIKKEPTPQEELEKRRKDLQNRNKTEEEIIEENKKKHQNKKNKKGTGAILNKKGYQDRMNEGTRTRYPK